ncbi:hypothetical protein [Dyadobacter sp. MSC1_007]|jgi:hypothetical protein|uniref:hypothetical protein n=1 Tax=Dyadobacter sp. MSC1_007 TaxID=2909264 RepID=UPI002030D417|nr:hypothetical protein [Dyadobacter sp. MSC1_007]
MIPASQTKESDIFRIIGLSEEHLSKVDDPDSVWLVYPFEHGLARPIAAFTEFVCAFDLASRLNAFVETGVAIQPVSSSSTNIEVDKYRQLTEVGMTPFLIRMTSQVTELEVIDDVSCNLDEISLENDIAELVTNLEFRRRFGWEFDLVGTFWAPSRRLAIKKARAFSSIICELKDQIPSQSIIASQSLRSN